MLLIGPLITIAVLALAAAFGGRAEREAAAVVAAALAVWFVLRARLGATDELPLALADLLMVGGFLLLAVRHRRPWLYGETALCLVLLAAHLVRDGMAADGWGFVLLVDGVNVAGLALLGGATAAHRLRAGRAPAAA